MLYNILQVDILFWFRKSSKDPSKGSLQLRINFDTQRVEIGSTHINCLRTQWDAEHQCLIGQTQWAKDQNSKLKRLHDRITKLTDDLDREGFDITAALIKECFLRQDKPSSTGIQGVTHRRSQWTFSELALMHSTHQAGRKRLGKISQATLDIQTNYAANIKDFVTAAKKERLPASSLRSSFMEELEHYLKLDEQFGGGHIEKHLKYVKQVLKWAASTDQQLIKKNPLAEYTIEGYNEQPDTTHLKIDELARLIDFDFHSLVGERKMQTISADVLSQERDAFCFNCFTGMHHGDYANTNFRIEQENDQFWLVGRREKTNLEFTLMLLEPAVAIFKRYGEVLANLPVKSNQRRNDSLKLIAVHVNLPYNLSTKIARKTFADLALNEMLIPADDVAAMLGLASTDRLKHYVRPRRRRLSKLMIHWRDLSKAAS